MTLASALLEPIYAKVVLVRRLLRGPGRGRQPYNAKAHVAAATTAYWLVRAFYLLTIYVAFATLRRMYDLGASGLEISPLWPVFWVDTGRLAATVSVLGLGFVAASMAAVAWPRPRWPRVLVAVLGLLCLGLLNSFGSINHSGHFWLWTAICFAALPTVTPDHVARNRSTRQHFLAVFFTAQCLVALFYTLSGSFKALSGIHVQGGAVSSFAPDALPLLVMQRWLETGESTMLADLFVDNLWLAWPAHLFVIYIELFAVVAVFRPELHRAWGTALMTFHVCVWVLMGISFPYQPMLVALLFVCSPFQPEPRPRFVQILRQLPGVGDMGLMTCRLALLFMGRDAREMRRRRLVGARRDRLGQAPSVEVSDQRNRDESHYGRAGAGRCYGRLAAPDTQALLSGESGRLHD